MAYRSFQPVAPTEASGSADEPGLKGLNPYYGSMMRTPFCKLFPAIATYLVILACYFQPKASI